MSWPLLPTKKRENFYLNHAGLALILPSVPLLFQQLNYLDEFRVLRDSNKKIRAIHLIHYLATGQEGATEQELLLNKLVCAFPLAESLPRQIALSAQEKREADHYLAALIKHWGKLKNTSVAGLRHNFILRNGKLSHQDDCWRLLVEQAVYDSYLMDALPWTISILKFKWMPERIHVDWI